MVFGVRMGVIHRPLTPYIFVWLVEFNELIHHNFIP